MKHFIEAVESPMGTLATRVLIWALAAVIAMSCWIYLDDRADQKVFRSELAGTLASINAYLSDARVERAQLRITVENVTAEQKKIATFLSERVLPKIDDLDGKMNGIDKRLTGVERDVDNAKKK